MVPNEHHLTQFFCFLTQSPPDPKALLFFLSTSPPPIKLKLNRVDAVFCHLIDCSVYHSGSQYQYAGPPLLSIWFGRWGGWQPFAFLMSGLVMLMLLIWGPFSESQWLTEKFCHCHPFTRSSKTSPFLNVKNVPLIQINKVIDIEK